MEQPLIEKLLILAPFVVMIFGVLGAYVYHRLTLNKFMRGSYFSFPEDYFKLKW